MSHLLILELPGADDTDILDAAFGLGHEVSFLTGDLAAYQAQPAVLNRLSRTRSVVEVKPFVAPQVAKAVLELHAARPIEAVLCLVDIRIVDAARIAECLHLPFLNVESAMLMRDKYSVRVRLRARGITQPGFALATSNAALRELVNTMGPPVVIKPCDGYGSQNVVALRDADDLLPWMTPVDDFIPQRLDYGLAVTANDRLVIERLVPGTVIGCDTLSRRGRHQVIALNEKLFFPPPSFAIRGSCVPFDTPLRGTIEAYACAVLDAVDFDWGIAHLELAMTPDGPLLVEINPRLVGAKIARLVNLALGRSLHADLISLHLGKEVGGEYVARCSAVSRWFSAPTTGTLRHVRLPERPDAGIQYAEVLKACSTRVRPPNHNGERIGYVMTKAPQRAEAERLADAYVADVELDIDGDTF